MFHLPNPPTPPCQFGKRSNFSNFFLRNTSLMYTPERQQKLQTVIIEQLMQKNSIWNIYNLDYLILKDRNATFMLVMYHEESSSSLGLNLTPSDRKEQSYLAPDCQRPATHHLDSCYFPQRKADQRCLLPTVRQKRSFGRHPS